MSLTVLAIFVGAGLVGLYAMMRALGLSQPLQFATEAEARRAWEREFPGIAVQSVALCQSKGSALIHTAQGIGLVWPMGIDSTARMLAGARVTPTATGLDVRLPDFGAPHVHLSLSKSEIKDWARRLEEST